MSYTRDEVRFLIAHQGDISNAEQGLQGGINAIIVGNYLTTLGRPQEQDLDMMGKLRLPIKALNATV